MCAVNDFAFVLVRFNVMVDHSIKYVNRLRIEDWMCIRMTAILTQLRYHPRARPRISSKCGNTTAVPPRPEHHVSPEWECNQLSPNAVLCCQV